jgi:hypothetical protein
VRFLYCAEVEFLVFLATLLVCVGLFLSPTLAGSNDDDALRSRLARWRTCFQTLFIPSRSCTPRSLPRARYPIYVQRYSPFLSTLTHVFSALPTNTLDCLPRLFTAGITALHLSLPPHLHVGGEIASTSAYRLDVQANTLHSPPG